MKEPIKSFHMFQSLRFSRILAGAAVFQIACNSTQLFGDVTLDLSAVPKTVRVIEISRPQNQLAAIRHWESDSKEHVQLADKFTVTVPDKLTHTVGSTEEETVQFLNNLLFLYTRENDQINSILKANNSAVFHEICSLIDSKTGNKCDLTLDSSICRILDFTLRRLAPDEISFKESEKIVNWAKDSLNAIEAGHLHPPANGITLGCHRVRLRLLFFAFSKGKIEGSVTILLQAQAVGDKVLEKEAARTLVSMGYDVPPEE